MGNNEEIKKRMETYEIVLIAFVWVGAVIGVIAGLCFMPMDFLAGLVRIILSIVGGVIAHCLICVILAISFILLNNGDMLAELKQPINGNAGDTISGNASSGNATPITVCAANLAEKLAPMAANTAVTPYTVTLEPCNISDNWGAINAVVQNAVKYIILDLSACTAVDNILRGNREPTGNDSNIIKGNKYIKGIILPDSLTSIGDFAFYSCTNLTSVTIPPNVTSIGKEAFNNCGRLTSVAIPEGVGRIGVFAFSGCGNLTSITIPSSITSIDGSAFYVCMNLTSVTFSLGSNISEDNFGNCVFPEGSYGYGGNTLKKAYATGKAGTYMRGVNGDTWTKQ